MKKNGFTFIEMLIAIVVLGILLGTAIPSFSEYQKKLRVKSLASEVEQFMSMARSEAVLRNTPMFVHLIGLDSFGAQTNWCLLLSESSAVTGCHDHSIYLVRGQDHKYLTVRKELTSDVVEYDSINGRPVFSTMGVAGYTDILSFYQNVQQPLMTKVHFLGRSKVCGVGGDWYGIKGC